MQGTSAPASTSPPQHQQPLIMQQQNAEAPPPPPRPTAVTVAARLVGCAVLVVLTQVLAYLGGGKVDPWVGGGQLTVLQVTAGGAVLVQVAAFVPAYLAQTEIFYDLTGALTYVACVVYSLVAGRTANGGVDDAHSFVLSAFVWAWAARLGTFLFARALRAHGDDRFELIKPSPSMFLLVWIIQGLWIVITCLPAYIVNSSQSLSGAPAVSTAGDVIGICLFAIGLLGEALADHQKSVWKAKPENKDRWIHEGLWRYSRHPNYFFEFVLHLGMFLYAMAAFQGSQWVAVISPLFVAFLLRFVSGVPILERRSDKKFGTDPEYVKFKNSTSLCIPVFCCSLPPNREDFLPGQQCLV